MDDQLKAMLDEWELHKLGQRFATAVDRLNEPLLRAIFTPDATMQGPGWRFSGIDEICQIFPMLKDMFVSTWHAMHNQTVDVQGDRATGETYCMGRHLQRGNYVENQVLTMTLRYQDEFIRTADGWRFSSRKQIVDWTETSTIQYGERQ